MKLFSIFFLLLAPVFIFAQQVADSTYNPIISSPAYAFGEGPVVFIDEGHHNFHTKTGRYKAFANLLERDGYVIIAYKGEFEREKLNDGKILVISNALNKLNVGAWYLPNPSAFSEKEIGVVKDWVRSGGNLFLIADHMPMAGAARDLAAAFGFGFTNGFAMDTTSRGPAFFTIEDNTLNKSIITKGGNKAESVKQIASFTGQAFKIPDDATPILTFTDEYVNFLPDTAWVFTDKTEKYNLKGWHQGAFKTYGDGKIVVFGEAAMFTAQLAGPQKIKAGMNNKVAPENYKLLLNIIHWLDGKLD